MTSLERQKIAQTQLNYPPGTRLELIAMGDDPHPIEAGTRGTILGVDDAEQILMRWDNGRSLSLIPGEDSFRKLAMEEVAADEDEEMGVEMRL
ncbi:MAG TPA: DUF4314 domain-containing protein [Candidatus Faecousia intestinigallinarum]|nr:DUF4314 domain-containing protein [Candidatus Faecousia intestinigallinarum]